MPPVGLCEASPANRITHQDPTELLLSAPPDDVFSNSPLRVEEAVRQDRDVTEEVVDEVRTHSPSLRWGGGSFRQCGRRDILVSRSLERGVMKRVIRVH